jgi:molybdopterin-synthase adenylyltransferase
MNPEFSEAELLRYSRNIILAEVGLSGQERIKSSSVLLVGVGGIGSPAALYLAAAGVGRIGLVDSDIVELSNLQRQVLFRTSDVNGVKVEQAKEAIFALNPHCVVETHHMRLHDAEIARKIVRGYDAVIDGSDTFRTRFLVADCCWLEGVALVSASAVGFQGQLLVVVPRNGDPCYRCLIPEPLPGQSIATCGDVGIFGGVVGIMGSLAAVETVKLFLGHDPGSAHRFLAYDGLRSRFITAERVRDPHCPLCGELPTDTDAVEEDPVGYQRSHAMGSFRNREEREPSTTYVGTGE